MHLLPYANRILGTNEEIHRQVEDLKGLRTGRVTLGASTTIADYLLPPALTVFANQHPGLNLSLRVGNTQEILRMVREEECELGLVEGKTDDENLDVRAYFEDELIVVAPPGHPLFSDGPVPARVVMAFPFVMREPGSGTRSIFEEAIQGMGLRIKERISLGSTEGVKRAVRAGLGLGAVSRVTASDELSTGALVEIRMIDLIVKRSLCRLMRRDRLPSGALKALMASLRYQLEDSPNFVGFGERFETEFLWDPVI
jgi:DNA-binding transcriptional LysR family regulator